MARQAGRRGNGPSGGVGLGKGLLAQLGAARFNYRAANGVKIALDVQLGL